MRGGEKVLEVFCEIFPHAKIFTLFHFKGSVSETIERHEIRASSLMRFPAARKHYRSYLPLFPRAIERFDLREFDLVLSSSHCVAKGARTGSSPHLCYCHTPIRYFWDRFDDYFGSGRSLLNRWAARLLRGRMQRWDVASNREVDHFVANSAHVAGRIQRYYHREAEVVHPPVDFERFGTRPLVEPPDIGDEYLIVSALAPYKKVDLAVEVFKRSGRKLLIIGGGQDEDRLRRQADGASHIRFLGRCPDDEVTEHMRNARAFLLTGEEDFGITPLEAMASGRPVIALGRGGACETVVDLGKAADPERPATGVLFDHPEPDSLERAIEKLESNQDAFDPLALRAHAETFSLPRFRASMENTLLRFLAAAKDEA